jgi:hypothetical protein
MVLDYEVNLGLSFGGEPATPYERGEADDTSLEAGRDGAAIITARDSRSVLSHHHHGFAELRWIIASPTSWTSVLAPKTI